MAGPTVVVRFLGDLANLGKGIKDAGKVAESVGSKLHSAFSGVLGVLNKTGVLGPFGEALSTIDEGLDQMGKKAKDNGDKLIAIGGIMAGVGVGLAALGSHEKQSHDQLSAAIEATGKSYDDYSDQIEKAIKKNEKYGQSSAATQDALRALTQATGDPAKALQLLGTATDLAAAKHESLSSAATQLGRTYNGASKMLKEFGIEAAPKAAAATKALESATKQAGAADDAVTKAKQKLADVEALYAGKAKLSVAQSQRLRDAQANVTSAIAKARDAHAKLAGAQDTAKKAAAGQMSTMDELSAKLKGQAAASVDSFTGKLKVLGVEVEDQAAKFGQKYGPAITALGSAMAVVGGVVKTTQAVVGAFTKTEEAATAATEATAAAEDGATAAGIGMMATMGLVVLAVLALVAVGYVIYRNWSTIWGAIKAAVKAVFDWIKVNWPLLLAILTGPIGLAVLLIVKYWNQIKAGAAAALTWLRQNWPLILAILTGPIGLAVLAIQRNWGAIKDGASAAVQWVKDQFNGLVSFFSGLPGRMGRMFAGMFDGIWEAFKSAVNRLINGWNSLHFTLPSIDTHIPGVGKIGGSTVGVPRIQPLATGGLITASGLFYGHAGEAVTPLPKGGLGPAVVINDAHFSSAVDIDLFMRRVAFEVKKAAI